MKLNKILAAALVAASSASSMAAIINGQTSGNGELMLVMWDAGDKVSYVKDLGIQIDSFVPSAGLSFALSDTFFTSFLNVANTTSSDIRFAVVGGDGFGARRLFSTFDPASVDLTTPLSGSLNTSANNYLNTFVSALNLASPNGDHSTNVNGTSFAIEGEGNRYALPNMPTLQSAFIASTTGAVVGTNAGFKSFASSNASGTQATKILFDGVWSVTNNAGAFTANYTVAAVPEADGIAMALAGLGALGFVALRRRQS
jgi:hypothetical protein